MKLAIEAAEKFGFNEIQFDYVRFPESSYEMSKSGKADFRNKYNEEKGQAVQNFCIYAADMLHEKGVYMSVDVFGESYQTRIDPAVPATEYRAEGVDRYEERKIRYEDEQYTSIRFYF